MRSFVFLKQNVSARTSFVLLCTLSFTRWFPDTGRLTTLLAHSSRRLSSLPSARVREANSHSRSLTLLARWCGVHAVCLPVGVHVHVSLHSRNNVYVREHHRAPSRVMSAPSLRLCEVERAASGSCGFHLSRTQWDPYPWVSGVEGGSPAEAAGLQTGDCVLEVNGEDILGRRIGQVADKVREKRRRVTLLLWNAGSDPHAAAGVYGGGATPVSLQRLSSCLQAVLQLLECPVCLEPAPPPAAQCYNGHVLCSRCRARAVRCPVCRVPLGPRGRCLLADKLHNLLATTFTRHDDQRRRRPANLLPGHSRRPLMQLKSRLLLQTKASSEENISSSNVDAKQVVAGSLRVRSLSTGQLPDCDSNDLEATKSYGDQIMYSCPYIPN